MALGFLSVVSPFIALSIGLSHEMLALMGTEPGWYNSWHLNWHVEVTSPVGWEDETLSAPASCQFIHWKISTEGTSLVVQWLRIHLPMQGTWVWSLVQEDATWHRATKPVCRKHWACALESTLRNKRCPGTTSREQPPLTAARESPPKAMRTQSSQKKLI